ncbi:SDR family oxidoreductase [Streptomyces sp. SAS_260]|uniref:SDR family oxidoreductase n=1 Tax=Streptomyces sp. SAS_260 TaxID=3412751 RepID=UPI00403C33D2
MDLGLKDRAYVVTGGTRGLGYAVARELVADSARVVVTGRDGRRAAEAAAELGPHAAGVGVDNADPHAPHQLIALARELYRGLDGILVSVGGPSAGGVAATTDAQWAASFESVFLSAVRPARAAAAELTAGGAIGLVLSGTALPNGLRPGLAGLAKSLADELGPRGIRVVGVLPGRIATDRMRDLAGLAPAPDARRATNEAAIPLRRYGTAEEFGRAGAFLLSPAASYVSGVMVSVDGGARRGV